MSNALVATEADALAAWRAAVRANRDQAERMREAREGPDFYAPVAGVFKADPRRTGEDALDHLRALAQPGETWLDIGAGGGRYALPLALIVKEVIALDPSDAMLRVLAGAMTEYAISNVRPFPARWPLADPPTADVCLIAHVGYDIEDLRPFLDAMEGAAGRLCVAVLLSQTPAAPAYQFWPAIHGEARAPLPALPEFLALLLARGRLFDVRLSERPPVTYPAADVALNFLRQQLFLAVGSEKDRVLVRLLEGRFLGPGGEVRLSDQPGSVGVVSWRPR